MRPSTMLLGLALTGSLASGCDKSKDGPPSAEGPGSRGDTPHPGSGGDTPHPGPRGTPPPPPAEGAAKPGACNGGGGEIKDAIAAPLLPRVSGGFCINPDGATMAFGEKASKPIGNICELFDGGCEQYLKLAIKRLVRVDYIDGAGGGATVTVDVEQFASPEHAFALFTQRLSSGDDPTRPDMPKLATWGSVAAMGTGTVYMWKGVHVVEMSYVNTNESGDQTKLKASADKVLPVIGKAILDKLPGDARLPAASRRLPTADQVPLGYVYAMESALGAEGTGQHATGFYREGERRFRMIAIVKDDPEQAKDVVKTFAKKKGATEEKTLGDGGVRLMVQEGDGSPKAEWLVARKGGSVIGIGDDAFALKPGASAAEHDKVCLSKEDKAKRLRAALDAGGK